MKKGIMTLIVESKKLFMVFLVTSIAVTALLICASCSDATGIEDTESDVSAELQLNSVNNAAEAPEETLQELDVESVGDLTSEEAAESEVVNAPQSYAPEQASAQPSESSRPAQSASNSNANTPASEPQKHWVEDIERVWIVDSAAWSEQKPIYETRELSVCNVCGADITANPSPHTKAHMLAGEGGGYHSEVRQVQVGSETINHPEVGHWETKVVGGH